MFAAFRYMSAIHDSTGGINLAILNGKGRKGRTRKFNVGSEEENKEVVDALKTANQIAIDDQWLKITIMVKLMQLMMSLKKPFW